MFQGAQISELVDLLNKRGVQLYHSCQFIDFKSYLKLGGIPSRQKLVDEGLEYTHFDTDITDHENKVWDKVFVNLQDFGILYQRGYGIPTVYGPIQLKLRPQALLESKDVAIALRSAGSPNFNRESESLKGIDEVNRLFEFPHEPGETNLERIKMTEDLKIEFRKTYVSNPEISLLVNEGLLSLSNVEEILVDSYWFRSDYLYNHVLRLTSIGQSGKLKEKIKFRKSWQDHNNEIAEILLTRDMSLKQIMSLDGVSLGLKIWAEKMSEKGLGLQWDRYSKYFRNGTLLPIVQEVDALKNKTIIPYVQEKSPPWTLYTCERCGKLVMGFDKASHEEQKHTGKAVEWKKIN